MLRWSEALTLEKEVMWRKEIKDIDCSPDGRQGPTGKRADPQGDRPVKKRSLAGNDWSILSGDEKGVEKMHSNKGISRRDFLRASAAGAVGLLASACAPQVVEKTVEVEVEKIVKETVEVEVIEEVEKTVEVEKVVTAPPEEAVEIRLSHWVGNFITPIMPYIEDEFNVKIVEESTSYADYLEKTVTQLVGGVAADFLFLEKGLPSPLYTDGFIYPLDAVVDVADVDHSLWAVRYPEDLYFRGEIYALPAFVPFGVGYGVNLDLIEEEGFDVPHPWPFYGTPEFDRFSWDKLLENFKACTKRSADGEIEIWGDGTKYHSWWASFAVGLRENGGRMFDSDDADETHCLINSPEGYEAFKRYFDLITEHQVAPEMGAGEAFKEGLWRSKKCACSGTWYFNKYGLGPPESVGFNFRYIWLPHFDKGIRTIVKAANLWGVNAASPHRDLCAEIVTWMVTDFDFANELFYMWGNLPSYNSAAHLGTVKDPWDAEAYEGMLARYEAFSDCEWCTEGMHFSPWQGKNPQFFETTFNAEYQAALSGQKTLQEALDEIVGKVDAELAVS